eukprot:8467577-Lingulodinium_polyedra.AAC.1
MLARTLLAWSCLGSAGWLLLGNCLGTACARVERFVFERACGVICITKQNGAQWGRDGAEWHKRT